MKNLIQRFIREEAGQDLVEYAFLVTFIAVFAIVVLGTASSSVVALFQRIVDAIS
jgi:Flp pilus assembly pilin Flp